MATYFAKQLSHGLLGTSKSREERSRTGETIQTRVREAQGRGNTKTDRQTDRLTERQASRPIEGRKERRFKHVRTATLA